MKEVSLIPKHSKSQTLKTMNNTIKNNPTYHTSNVDGKQTSSQNSTTGAFHGVSVSSLGGYKPTPGEVTDAGFTPLTKNPPVVREKGTKTSDQEALDPLMITRRKPQKGPSIEPSTPPLDDPNGLLPFRYKYNITEEITEEKREAGFFFTKVSKAIPEANFITSEESGGIEATPLPISYFEEKSKEARNLATTYRLNNAQDKATILDLKANFLDGQDQQAHLKQSFDFPEDYSYTTMGTSNSSSSFNFNDKCSLFQEYEKGAEYCQKFLKYYEKNPNKKAAIMGYAKNLNDYCKYLNKVSQELENGNFCFDTSANAKNLLAQSKKVDQDYLWNFENLPSCSIS